MLPRKKVTRLFRAALVRLYFRRVQELGTENIPDHGVILFACVHRNGAVDGVVMESVLPNPIGIAGKNLTGSPYLRLFFGESIAIYRHPSTSAENRENLRQFKQVARLALDGRPIVMFPEGTSALGPSLLPVKRGLAYLARLTFKEAGEIPVFIVPVGLHYSRGFEFRSDVEITYGASFNVGKDDVQDLDVLTKRITNAMSTVAVNFKNTEEQRYGELFADSVCSQHKANSHRNACLVFANNNIPLTLRKVFISTIESYNRDALPPILPKYGMGFGLLEFILLSPIIFVFFMANIFPLTGTYTAARILADDDNVITLWRTLVGVPLFTVQMLMYLVTAFFIPQYAFHIFAIYSISTLLGVLTYRRWKVSLAGVVNMFSKQRKVIMKTNKLIEKWINDHTE